MSRPKKVADTELLEQARACFLEHGASVSAAVIAERAGVTTPVLFQRFGSKQELLRAALAPRPEDLPAVLERGRPRGDRPLGQQLAELFDDIAHFFETMIPAATVLRFSACGPGEGESGPERSHRLLVGWLEAAVAEGMLRPHDSRTLALHLLGALQVGPLLGQIAPGMEGLPERGRIVSGLAEMVEEAYGEEKTDA